MTERGIWRTKVRVKTVRELTSQAGMLNPVALTQRLYTPQAGHDLRELGA